MEDSLQCILHPEQACASYCLQCSVPVCGNCITECHQHHGMADIEEMESIKQVKRREMEEDSAEIEEILIPQFRKEDTNIENQISKTLIRYEALEETAESYRSEWHDAVDKMFDEYHREIHNARDKDIATLKNGQLQIRKTLLEMPQIIQLNTEALQSDNNSNKIIQYKSKLSALRNSLPKFEVGIPTFTTPPIQVGKGLCVEFGEIRSLLISMNSFDSMTTGHPIKRLLDRLVIKADFSSNVENLLRMVYNGRNEVWLSGKEGNISHVNIHGTNLESLEAVITKLQDISVTSEGELIYSDYLNKTLNIVKGSQTDILLEMEPGWHPQGVFCTKVGHILVTMRTAGDSRCKIVRYEGKDIVQEIQYDKSGNSLFSSGYKCVFLAENNNGDICASDTNSSSLVVVNKAGDLHFAYHCDTSLRRKSFVPDQIVTDSLCQIILTDYVNNCLHIFHRDGQYLKCISHPDIDLPIALAIDNEDRLWVGQYVSGNVKVIQYMK
ncbi:uncharacterized protein LOC133178401 [Saccostrea echinata]|uniref:uncharacterized protein LOC133178401 n=1 Tax=Saccostrea echinata TaxID=191078 RepID=UPI002A83E455|nr:uncharacterized protein LOC133178401 [Saccostrea echinata]